MRCLYFHTRNFKERKKFRIAHNTKPHITKTKALISPENYSSL